MSFELQQKVETLLETPKVLVLGSQRAARSMGVGRGGFRAVGT